MSQEMLLKDRFPHRKGRGQDQNEILGTQMDVAV